MTPLPPHLDRLHAELMAAADADAAATRRRPTPRLAAVVAFAVLTTGGVALAATTTNPIDWFRGGDPSRELRIAPDDSRRIDGDFADGIACPTGIDGGVVTCRVVQRLDCAPTVTRSDGGEMTSCASTPTEASPTKAGSRERSYQLMTRVEARPQLGPAPLRTVLAGRRPDEVLFPDAPARYRLTVARVLELADRAPQDFWRGMDLLVSVQGGNVSAGDPDAPNMERVPPEGVRRFVTCIDDGGLRCRPLTNGETLPLGAPMYALQPDTTWRSVPQRATGGADFLELQRQAFGHELTGDEQVLVAAMLLPARTTPREGSGSSSAGATTTPAAPAAPGGSRTPPTPAP